MTVSSATAVYNLALNAVGARDNISSPTEQSREAEVCHLWYSPVRDQILAASAWPEATEMRYLSLSSEQDDTTWTEGEPRPGYLYRYSRPVDMLRPQYMTDFSHFLLTEGGFQSNTAEAVLVYTKRLESVSSWNAELQMAVVYGLAAHICMPLTGKPRRARELLNTANEMIAAAREHAANSSQEQYDVVPDWIAARGYTGSTSMTRYVYPNGSLLGLPSVG